ncbi:trypsin, alkaline B-like [Pararge aegeria]|uniref:Jg22135 protein n=1 Tax=Pararge aegeria aegeria TaxID=348720 RepID=A0A8S4RRP5_9NEOP|nr:trypsin, alkaline B-like [Pararge aegeria]CAH2240161.1 jg22135 [Pararge aegeria aegeria]
MVAKVLCLALALFCAVSADNRIVGGTPVSIQEFPSVVAVVYHYPRPDIYIQRCAGAVISSWHVLTTAFCFTGATLTNAYLRGGSSESLSGGQLTGIRQMIQHPDYDATTRFSDIAVVVTSQPFVLSGSMNILYIPPANTYLPDGLQTRVAGWGFETEEGPQHDSLKAITLTTVNLEQCKKAYEDVEDIDIKDSVICAANENAGTCFGDSGAPMIYNNVIIGISSYYKDCGNSAYPDVFTKVDSFTDWIMETAVAPTGETPLRSASIYY